MTSEAVTLDRALFLLTGGEAGERFHRVLGDLVDAGLRRATLLYVLEGAPADDPFLEEVGMWARRFEAAGLDDVAVALKRGDAGAWVRELSAMTPGQWVIAATPRVTPEGFLRPASSWRNLRVPVLLVPPGETGRRAPLFERAVVGLKDPERLHAEVADLRRGLPGVRDWRGLHVRTDTTPPAPDSGYPIPVATLQGDRYDIADNLLAAAHDGAGLLVLFARPEGIEPDLPVGYVVEAVARGTEVPLLLWPGKPEPGGEPR